MPAGLDGIKLVPTLHDITPLLPDDRNALQRWRNARRFKKTVKQISTVASLIITGSQFAQNSIETEFPSLVGKLHVVPHFPDQKFSPIPHNGQNDAEAIRSLNLPINGVLFLAALRRHKNWETLLRAWAMIPTALQEKHPLILAGDARRAKGLPQKIARELGVLNNLYLPGRIPDESLPALYRSASIFVFPSLAEGFGLPPLEAMACGTAVISSNSTSLPEVLGDAALFAEPHDTSLFAHHIAELLSQPSMRQEQATLGLKQASCWSAQRTGEAMIAVLQKLS
jgi:glycosyltransferase involved in cell wall biosynthesis